jgi:chromosome partitioning protein
MTLVVAVCAFKGGVGKTTVTANVAAAWSSWGTGAVIDLDPQGNLTKAMGLGEASIGEHGARTAADLLDLAAGDPSARVQDDDWSVSYIEGTRPVLVLEAGGMKHLEGVQEKLARAAGGPTALMRLLKDVREELDWVLIDTPPSSARLTLNAVLAADSVFAVVNPAYWSSDGAARIAGFVEENVAFIPSAAVFRGAIVNRLPGGRRDVIAMNLEALEAAAVEAGVPVLAARIPERNAVQEGETLSEPIVSADPRSDAAQSFIELAAEMRALATGKAPDEPKAKPRTAPAKTAVKKATDKEPR